MLHSASILRNPTTNRIVVKYSQDRPKYEPRMEVLCVMWDQSETNLQERVRIFRKQDEQRHRRWRPRHNRRRR